MTAFRPAVALMPLALAGGIAGCDSSREPAPPPLRDPQVAQALGDPLMTDPDLSTQNQAAAALTVESDFSLPVLPATPKEIARAKAAAAEMVGGSDKLVAPPRPAATMASLAADAGPAARLAARLPGGACADSLQSSAIWAARMPAAIPIYPRAHTLDAAGSDAKGCKVRTVAFTTPVARADVIAFYLAQTAAIGGEGQPLARAGADLRLVGAAGRIAYDILARPIGDHTLVRLTTIET